MLGDMVNARQYASYWNAFLLCCYVFDGIVTISPVFRTPCTKQDALLMLFTMTEVQFSITCTIIIASLTNCHT